jgi:hypothetical protein
LILRSLIPCKWSQIASTCQFVEKSYDSMAFHPLRMKWRRDFSDRAF